jgi:hypothetical protein
MGRREIRRVVKEWIYPPVTVIGVHTDSDSDTDIFLSLGLFLWKLALYIVCVWVAVSFSPPMGRVALTETYLRGTETGPDGGWM